MGSHQGAILHTAPLLIIDVGIQSFAIHHDGGIVGVVVFDRWDGNLECLGHFENHSVAIAGIERLEPVHRLSVIRKRGKKRKRQTHTTRFLPTGQDPRHSSRVECR
jgi:hypothetical protein